MKKTTILIVLIVFGLSSFAQKKNGAVFIEHPAIEKTHNLWSAFEKGDKELYGSFLNDSIAVIFNGKLNKRLRDGHAKNLDWWSENFDNLKVVVDTPAYADALEYKKGGVWVQDWLRIQAIHKKSGINMDLQIHNLYSFNEEGKITSLHHYFNNDVFEKINNSGTTRENGTVYINHPYIATVRKVANAFIAKDLDKVFSYYSPKASFANTTMKMGDKKDVATQKKEWEELLANSNNIKMKEVGYPDCIHYAKGDQFVVYSWWVYSSTNNEGQTVKFPMMLSHTFDKDGKIISDVGYWSSNHYE